MTRKDYEAIAKALKASKPARTNVQGFAVWQGCVRNMVDCISLDNIRFDADKFFKACDYE